ncbi:hypothetical protein C1N91_02100 [Curtobacterium sp. SGAir0471]|uniref:hypothetical protein n=1 Tax=Curtobacterium sp. SGAir0471 TaxID=2070337 RepID=UPI0010CD08EB|nr:hypothetical protein [Curtobacterium sp. SGAir0471]QCR42514.1 hypothetical protein C1N91_02100 [Curtobacterium sp. SGAir0471]
MRSRPSVVTIAVGTALTAVLASSGVSGPAFAATDSSPSTGASTAPSTEASTKAISIRTSPPTDVSVSVGAEGFTVRATPHCDLAPECKSSIRVLSAGFSTTVDTRNGALVPWPTGWAEGETRTDGLVFSAACDGSRCYTETSPGVSLGSITRPVTPRALSAEVTARDDAARTARVEGTATPGASIRVDGAEVARVDSSGRWSHELRDLAVGDNVRTYQQYVDGSFRDERRVTVRIEETRPVFTGTVSFDDDVTQRALVAGAGVPGARVVLVDGTSTVGETTVGADGRWSLRIDAPDRGGVRRLTATHTAAGQGPETVGIDVDYGQAVRITSPGNGFVIPPAFPAVRISGTAAPGAVVRLSERGVSGSDLGSATAGADGRWAIRTPALPQRDHVLQATATSRGANSTSATLELLGG